MNNEARAAAMTRAVTELDLDMHSLRCQRDALQVYFEFQQK